MCVDVWLDSFAGYLTPFSSRCIRATLPKWQSISGRRCVPRICCLGKRRGSLRAYQLNSCVTGQTPLTPSLTYVGPPHMQVYSIVNIVFITQSLSTLDSTFTSAGVFHPQLPA